VHEETREEKGAKIDNTKSPQTVKHIDMKCKTSKQNARKEQDIRTTGQSEMGK